jgi:hypothetical protein
MAKHSLLPTIDWRPLALATVALLTPALVALGSDREDAAPFASFGVQTAKIVYQDSQPPAEDADRSAPAAATLARDNAAVVNLALARPQPPDQPAAKLGPDVALLQGAGTVRPWGMSASAWEAPAFCHRPLYFEDENLERHGHSFGLAQPAVSAAHFAGRAVAWPYLAGAFPPHECIYTLGRERPGSCAPYRLYRPPVSIHGAVYEAAAITGLSFVVP